MNIQQLCHLVNLERHFTNPHLVLRSYISLDRSSAQRVPDKLSVNWCMLCCVKGLCLSEEAQIMRYERKTLRSLPRTSSFRNTSSCLPRFYKDVIIERQKERVYGLNECCEMEIYMLYKL